MLTATTRAGSNYVYRKTRPFTKAEYRFKLALADYATERLLPKLRARTAGNPFLNQYGGINARPGSNSVFLEAILTNETEWGGFGFDFARLQAANDGRYNLSIRKAEDWALAETSSVAAASNYFMPGSIYPRAADWLGMARGKTFEQCVHLIENYLQEGLAQATVTEAANSVSKSTNSLSCVKNQRSILVS